MSIRFTVIIATSNRPELAAQAIGSVLAQDYANLEVIVVNNGSSDKNLSVYNKHFLALKHLYGDRVRFFPGVGAAFPALGPSMARNLGIHHASGDYIGFCDDDDIWTDSGYLRTLAAHLPQLQPDIVFADQRAVDSEGTVTKTTWFSYPFTSESPSYNAECSSSHNCQPFTVTPAYFYQHGGFPHLNITFYRHELLSRFGGFRKDLFYEEDMELFLRLIGHSNLMLHYPSVVAEHRIPAKRFASASNMLTDRDKLLTRLSLFSQLAITHNNPEVIKSARRGACFAAKQLTLIFLSQREIPRAFRMAKLALSWEFSWKWLLGSTFLFIKSLFIRPGEPASEEVCKTAGNSK
ncbi:glycosyltransferase [Parasalinivibrio latis]|uniref:glycosyltransferase n=1 Tax=Parasalinivibrio latis TaxID=2952610 RepID=UPI0030E106A7